MPGGHKGKSVMDNCTGENCTFGKGVVVGINVVFAVFGIIVCIFGVNAVDQSDTMVEDAQIMDNLPTKMTATFVAVIGGLVMFTAVAGFIGGLCTLKRLMTVYVIFIVTLAIIQLFLGIFFLELNDGSLVDVHLESEWMDFSSTQAEADRVELQNWLSCCGYRTPDDSIFETPCQELRTVPDIYRVTPCRDAILEKLDEYFKPTAIACICLAVFEIVSLVITCVYMCNNKKVLEDFWDWQDDRMM